MRMTENTIVMQIGELFASEGFGVFGSPDFWAAFGASVARVVVLLIAAAIVAKIIGKAVMLIAEQLKRGADEKPELAQMEMEKRISTFSRVIRLTLKTALWSIAGIMALRELGFDVMPLLAGAGVAGLAIGFGAQNLVRDVITGLFMLFEDQASVGDIVEVNGKNGTVEEVNLRTIVLRDFEGTTHTIPNGTIQLLSNRTQSFSYYVFELRVAYKEDTDRVTELMREVSAEMEEDDEFGPLMLDALEIFGVDKLADSAVVIKARVKTKPISQWKVGREFNRRFKKRFDAEGVEIPFPHRKVVWESAELRGPGLDEDALRRIVREELEASREEAN